MSPGDTPVDMPVSEGGIPPVDGNATATRIEPVGEQAQASGVAEELRTRAHRLIPGGCHTYAKGDDQYPSNAPAFIARGSGCKVWDTERP